MKKYLFGALALPLLFACSSDDLLEEKVVGNDQFAGIEKVDATFSMDEGVKTRFDKGVWRPEEGDLWGFAWMGDGTNVGINGKAFQNHNLIQKDGIFTPQTSIYVGKYFIYRPYDKTTVSPQAINFKSLELQPLAEGYESEKQPWKDLAKTAINIGDKWTNVTPTGTTDAAGKTWDKAGIKEHYDIYAAVFSNQTGLDLTYVKNKVEAPAGGKHIAGATDIDYTIAAGTVLDAADIYEAKVQLVGAAKSFTYAPTAEPSSTHDGGFWADKKNLNTSGIGGGSAFTWASGTGYDEITLTAEDEENGVTTATENNKGWFWFNSLPVTDATGATSTNVKATLTTSYGVVTIPSTVGACAYEWHDFGTATAHNYQWVKLAATTDESKSPKEWDVTAKNTFINQYGNHKGKFELTADFSQGVMNGMKIKNDKQLQKLLKYYICAGKTENVVLDLEQASATDNTFELSKISIALLQTINATTNKVLVQPGTGTPKIIVTQDDQAGLGLADAKEVPNLDKVFNVGTAVYLASDCQWTWKDRTAPNQLTVDAKVNSITNEGILTVNAKNIELSVAGKALENAANATMNITQVTTVKTALTNYGTINVGDATTTSAELRAYGVEIKNDATALGVSGTINNYGVVGVSAGTSGKFNNYGLIEMENSDAITLLSANEQGTTPFINAFGAANKMGTVVLPANNPTAIVSVTNTAATGFIKYNWTGATYATPTGNVKYNTIVVSDDITFNAVENEIQFIEFNGTRTQVVNPTAGAYLPNLKGVIVNDGKSIILEATNILNPSQGVFLGTSATVYRGGQFTIGGAAIAVANTTNYLGTWSLDQIVEY